MLMRVYFMVCIGENRLRLIIFEDVSYFVGLVLFNVCGMRNFYVMGLFEIKIIL